MPAATESGQKKPVIVIWQTRINLLAKTKAKPKLRKSPWQTPRLTLRKLINGAFTNSIYKKTNSEMILFQDNITMHIDQKLFFELGKIIRT